MSGTTNIFGLLQPAGTTDPLAALSASPVEPGIAAIVSALYGPGLTSAQIASQTVADPDKTSLQLQPGQVGEEIFDDNSLGTSFPVPSTGVMIYDNSTATTQEEIVPEGPTNGGALSVVLGGEFLIISIAAQGAFIIASPAEGGGVVSHNSEIAMQSFGGTAGDGYTVEDDVGIDNLFLSGNNVINEDGSNYRIIAQGPVSGSGTTVSMTGSGTGGQIDVTQGAVFTQAGTATASVSVQTASTYRHTGSGTISASAQASTVDMLHGDLTLSSEGGNLIALGDGSAAITTAGSSLPGDTVVAGNGAATVSGATYKMYNNFGQVSMMTADANATVFGGSGALDFAGGEGTLVLGAGNSTVGGGVAGSQDEAFTGAGTMTYNGQAEKGFLIAGTGSVTVHAGSGGGWYSGGSNGNNSLTATGIGTVLVGGGNGDILTGDANGWTYLVAGSGNETLVGGNQAGTDFFFGGTGAELLKLGSSTSLVNAGAGASTIEGGGGTAAIFLSAGSGALLVEAGPGGDMAVTGFRLGTDHIGLDGQSVSAENLSGGSTALTLSGGATIELVGLDATHATNLFG